MSGIRWILVFAALAGCSSREIVVIYSPQGPDVLGDYERQFEAAHPEVDVQWLYMGSQEVYARVSGERNRPLCDVWWGGPTPMLAQAAEEGLLESYRPSWADAAAGVAHDPQDRWYATARLPLGIAFNTRRYSRETAPQSWDDLLDPRWKGKITLREPLASGTMRTFIGAMILRAPDEDEGIAWLKRLHTATESYANNPQRMFDNMRKNNELITVWLLPDLVLERERNGFPGDCVAPAPTPVITEGIAIVKGAPHREWAAKFYEFVTAPEALAHQAAAYAKLPARTDLDAEALPAWAADTAIEPMAIDWALLAAKTKAWCDRWEREVFNAP